MANDHDCVRAEEIGAIKATLQFFQEAELRREGREERMLSTMTEIAEQGAILKGHGETLVRHERSLSEAFARLRKVETPAFPPPGVTRFLNTKTGRVVVTFCGVGAIILLYRNPVAFANAIGKVIKSFCGI